MSMDYAIVVKGSIVLQLDGGKKVTLNEGDVACQRGTAHSWSNESSEWTRIYFVLLGQFSPWPVFHTASELPPLV